MNDIAYQERQARMESNRACLNKLEKHDEKVHHSYYNRLHAIMVYVIRYCVNNYEKVECAPMDMAKVDGGLTGYYIRRYWPEHPSGSSGAKEPETFKLYLMQHPIGAYELRFGKGENVLINMDQFQTNSLEQYFLADVAGKIIAAIE